MTIVNKKEDIISPIVDALANIIETQIDPPPTHIYLLPPDGAPDEDTATIIMTQYKVVDDTNGKLEIRMVFGIIHWFKILPHMSDAIFKAYQYLMPYIRAFSAWDNQESALWRIVQVSQGGIKTQGSAGEQRIGLTTNVEVVLEYNINI